MSTRVRRDSPASVVVTVTVLMFGLPLLLLLAWSPLIPVLALPVLAVAAAPFVVATALVRRRAARATAPAAAPRVAAEPVLAATPRAAPAWAGLQEAAFDPIVGTVTVTVSKATGTCPMGFTYREGAQYLFENGHVTPELCLVAQRAIQPLVADLRQGRYPTTVKPFCASSTHEVVFELEGAPVREEAPAPT